MVNTTRIGIVGLGAISRFYLAAFKGCPDLTLRAAADTRQETAALIGSGTAFYSDYRELLDDQTVDAVIINVPNHLHYDICKAALLADMHVCCEKPLATSRWQAKELVETAAASDRILFTAFHRRYNVRVLELCRRIEGRSPPDYAVIKYRERIEDHCGHDAWYLDPAKCGGGCLADNGPNAFDTALQILGPLTLTGARVMRRLGGVDLETVVDARTESGGMVRIELDWAYDFGEDKAVHLLWNDGHCDSADMLAGFTTFKSSLYHEYQGIVRDFAAAVRGDSIGGGNTGRPIVELVASAYQLTEGLVPDV
ncbi:Gfo/Idh/MocA family protein [Streptomyces collinus]|uniref:Gfo/Idh/MocA family protein n=1 Tax=Streptomyces collinus TaxID=42684 RepID=UPI00367FCE0D